MKKKNQRKDAPAKKPARSRAPAAKSSPPSEENKGFCVVGIGASAGGLEALEKFFNRMPSDSGLACVIVQHLDPDRKSMMVDILQRHTGMKVVEVEEGAELKPNRVYMIAPNQLLSIFNGKLHLNSAEAARVRLPIDFFFRSLAEDQKEKAICIVLSGTGSDGALGLKAVKEAGGMTMAQDETSAKYNSMPRAAVATGFVDYVLPPEAMPEALIKYVRHPYIFNAKTFDSEERRGEALEKIFMLLRSQSGHDFSLYKPSTISRRIERRMALHQINKLGDYLRFLERNGEEVRLLFKEFLIGVTRFFRDPEAFEALKKKVIEPLVRSVELDQPIRIWVAGCSTGEEAYSVAMLLSEEASRLGVNLKSQIFATDIDAAALEVGRAGLYSESIGADLSPQRLEQFFSKEGSRYRVKKPLREMVIFAKQDLGKDPPFSRLDLIVCRNLLIYFGGALQKKIVPLFHYTLNPGRFLMLGPSETVGEFIDLFSMLDKKWKIFQNKSVPRFAVNLPAAPASKSVSGTPAARSALRGAASNVVQLTENIVLEAYAPSYVIINEKHDILHFRGRTGRYLEPPSGEATLDILKWAKEGLRIELRTAIHRASKSDAEVIQPNVKIKEGGHLYRLNLIVKPIAGEVENRGGLLMVIFDEGKTSLPLQEDLSERAEGAETDRRITDLEQELNSTKESLQTAIEELETSNEELKSTNEELQSTNEELQSTNEELETSKEELQSINEELVTVNSELQNKVDELAGAGNDMFNLLAATESAILFLDNHLNVRRFTPAMTEVMNLMPGDVGRTVREIATYMTQPDLIGDIEEVLRKLAFKEKEVLTRQGRWYRMRISPYRTLDNMIDGVVIVFFDMTEAKRATERLQAALRYAESIIATIREPLLVLDKQLRVVSANDSYYRTFHVRKETVIGERVYSLGNEEWNIPSLRVLLEEVLSKGAAIEDYPVSHTFKEIGFKQMRLNARKVKTTGQIFSDADELILLAIESQSDAHPPPPSP